MVVWECPKIQQIYADTGCFDPVFTDAVPSASDTKLWEAQLNIWVTRDIVEAIGQTNNQVLQKFEDKDRNVLNSPVKRLISIDVTDDYYTGGGTGGGTQTGSGQFGMGSPMGRGSRDMFEMGPMGGMDGRPTPAQDKDAPSTLTERSCSKLYDVIHYRFVVVMSTRDLSLLQQNLLRLNNHTILKVEIEQIGLSAGRSGRFALADESLYYYGTDPVVQVKLDGELLLLTSWERGTWDSQANNWSEQFPPLVPCEVLEKIKSQKPDALRAEDENLLSGKSGLPGERM
ncbi:MAG: hypothetical protein ACYSTL_02700 [Planctomycetota bacterium]